MLKSDFSDSYPATAAKMKNLLPDTEAARLLGLKTQTLRNWRSMNQGPPYMVLGKRSIRYNPDDLMAFANARKVQPGA